MRMLTLALMMASAAPIPAYAQFRGHGAREEGQVSISQPIDEARAARHERREEERAARSEQEAQPAPDTRRRGRWGGGQQTPPVVGAPQPRGNQGQWDGNHRWQGRRDVMTPNTPEAPSLPHNRRWQDHRNDGRNWSDHGHDGEGQVGTPQGDRRRRDGDRHDGRRWDGHRDNGGFDRGHRGDHDRNWNNGSHHRDWNRTWRSDRRYDWQRHRHQYHHHYRAPRYYNPYGYRYGYRRFGIGIYLDSLFFSNRYWLSDPWEYRLPPAPYGTRWVRYYDDVLLVDIRSGYVVDVIHNFFW